jgi:hypothetical protein
MSTVSAAPLRFGVHGPRSLAGRAVPMWPTVAAIANALAVYVVSPNVGDLQAALARESAAANGVGLTYWFQWFGGGATPGNYSVLTPYLSSLVGALLLGVLATIAITPLAAVALAGTRFAATGTWIATIAFGLNIWSGRIPFAVGCAAGVTALIGVRRQVWALALVGAVVAALCSPVCGAFLALALLGAIVVDPAHRRIALTAGALCLTTLLLVALYFGTPGPQPYSYRQSLIAAATAAVMLAARPPKGIRIVLLCTVFASLALVAFPNGLGSNFLRFPYLCLPAVVVATAASRRLIAVLCVVPAMVCSAQLTLSDLELAQSPAASASYYSPLIGELHALPKLRNYRLEVVQNNQLHTAAYALIDHVALAGGYETQQQNSLNGLLRSPTLLDPASYKLWLDNTAVGYVAFDRNAATTAPEYQLVASRQLRYLRPVWHDPSWILYRVASPTPIVAAPERLVAATQSGLTIDVPCACSFSVRVRYSKFLGAATALAHGRTASATVRNDGAGWTVLTTPARGRYVLHGHFTR